MKRIKISKDINFIGCWNIENDNLCKKIIEIFENRRDLQRRGVTGYGTDEKAKKSVDISLDPKNLSESDFKDIKFYFEELFNCYQDYKKQWPFLKDNLKTLDIPTFNIQKYEPGGHFLTFFLFEPIQLFVFHFFIHNSIPLITYLLSVNICRLLSFGIDSNA